MYFFFVCRYVNTIVFPRIRECLSGFVMLGENESENENERERERERAYICVCVCR